MQTTNEKLYIRFHGRIIDSLGIQMYQRPVAAIAELIANAWDADATKVEVSLPPSLNPSAQIVIKDDGAGMTFQDCQNRYLNVGQNRRILDGEKSLAGRPLLGRKGIGKFAGFGISEIVQIDTVSGITGEHTVFELDINDLRSGQYVSTDVKPVDLVTREGPHDGRKAQHGTTVTLKKLKLSRRPNSNQFRESMARRYLLAQSASNFVVVIDGTPIPDDEALANTEFEFPRDYESDEVPPGMTADASWGIESLGENRTVRWRIRFKKDPIDEDELRGVSVFCRGKLAQAPFFFELSGGLGGQLGQQYMSGQVQADYLDSLPTDVITTERQRINWELDDTSGLFLWGQKRIKELLNIWKARRSEQKVEAIRNRLNPFGERMALLPSSERRVIDRALHRLAQLESISGEQFTDLAGGLLTAWEGGRLRGLIEQVSDSEEMTADRFVGLLVEEQVLSALHIAETVRAKIDVIHSLEDRIKNKDLELAVRDFIAKHPWLISPKWETYKVEKNVKHILEAAAKAAEIDKHPDWMKRVDLALSSGRQLLIIEFMRPGLEVDRDHLHRFQDYVDEIKSALRVNTAAAFREVSGLLVADKLNSRAANVQLIERLEAADMRCLEWPVLLAGARAQWRDFLDAVRARAPDDLRVKQLSVKQP